MANTTTTTKLPTLQKFDEPKPKAPKSDPAPEPGMKHCKNCHKWLTEAREGNQKHVCREKCECFASCPTKYVKGHPSAEESYRMALAAYNVRKAEYEAQQKEERDVVKDKNKRVRDEKAQKKATTKAKYESKKLRVGGYKTITKDVPDGPALMGTILEKVKQIVDKRKGTTPAKKEKMEKLSQADLMSEVSVNLYGDPTSEHVSKLAHKFAIEIEDDEHEKTPEVPNVLDPEEEEEQLEQRLTNIRMRKQEKQTQLAAAARIFLSDQWAWLMTELEESFARDRAAFLSLAQEKILHDAFGPRPALPCVPQTAERAESAASPPPPPTRTSIDFLMN